MGGLGGLTVAQAMAQERNNFTLVRLLLALAVVVSHAFSVTSGNLLDEPLTRLTGFTLGEHAVNGFFAISGFLVTMSFDKRGWLDYVIARTLRIAPGLIVATLVVALLVGPAMTSLSAGSYLSDGGTWRFIGATLITYKSNIVLPGVFSDNPFRFPMGTVWTLKYEVLCYGGVLLAGLLGLIRWRIAALALAAGLFIALAWLDLYRPDHGKGIETALRLPLIFALGAFAYAWRKQTRLSLLAVAVLAFAAFSAFGTAMYDVMLFTATAYGVLWLCLVPVRWSYDPPFDISYGTYLYGWPVQQSLHALFPGTTAVILLLPSLVLTVAVSTWSWFGVEKPALALKARALGRRTISTIEPAGP
jgi:peptidoglycan/LPS O-acetylase OafA/YrhL